MSFTLSKYQNGQVGIGKTLCGHTLIFPVDIDYAVSKLQDYPRINLVEQIQIPDLGIVSVKTGGHRMCLLKRSRRCTACNKSVTFCYLCIDNQGTLSLQFFTKQGDVFNVDHIQPASQGGKTELDNLQLMCSICNNKKGDSTELIEKRMQQVEARQRELSFKYREQT